MPDKGTVAFIAFSVVFFIGVACLPLNSDENSQVTVDNCIVKIHTPISWGKSGPTTITKFCKEK